MLKKLRWRFILSAMAAFLTVITALLCIINFGCYRIFTAQQDETLRILSGIDFGNAPDSKWQPFDKTDWFSPETPYTLRFFSVHFDSSGNFQQTQQQFIASVSQSQAVEYADTVLDGGKKSGYYSGYRYLVKTDRNGTTVVFLNSEQELRSMQKLLVMTLAIAFGCLAVVFILVVLFSHRAIAPYVRNLEAQKQFITNASHELKTPLTAIATSADVLAMEYDDDEWVQNIQTQSAKLSKLITNLITLSRLNEEEPFPTRTNFSLSDALWEITEPFIALAKAQGKEYAQNVEDNITVCGDRMAIQQTISILLDNAMKYTVSGDKILLSARKNGKKAEISVSNTCADGKITDTSKLFERFYRADESHSNAVGGTGIGLSIAKATIDAHNGSISAEQKDGIITFRIKI